jgi:hypothetical protein
MSSGHFFSHFPWESIDSETTCFFAARFKDDLLERRYHSECILRSSRRLCSATSLLLILSCLLTGILWTLQGSRNFAISSLNEATSSTVSFDNCPQIFILACACWYGFLCLVASLIFMYTRIFTSVARTEDSRYDEPKSGGASAVNERHLWFISFICQLLPLLALQWTKDYVITQIPGYSTKYTVILNPNTEVAEIFLIMVIWITYVDLVTLSRLLLGLW